VGNGGPDVMHEREDLAQEGIMIVNLGVDKFTGKLSRPPEITSRGFIATNGSTNLVDGLRKRISETAVRSNGSLQKDVEQVVGNYLYSETHRRPIIIVNTFKA